MAVALGDIATPKRFVEVAAWYRAIEQRFEEARYQSRLDKYDAWGYLASTLGQGEPEYGSAVFGVLSLEVSFLGASKVAGG